MISLGKCKHFIYINNLSLLIFTNQKLCRRKKPTIILTCKLTERLIYTIFTHSLRISLFFITKMSTIVKSHLERGGKAASRNLLKSRKFARTEEDAL